MNLLETAIVTEIKLRRSYHASIQAASLCQDHITATIPQVQAGIIQGFHTVLRLTIIPFADWYDNKYKNEEPLCTGNLLCNKRKWHLCRDTACKRVDSDNNHERHTCEYWTPAITRYAKEVSKA